MNWKSKLVVLAAVGFLVGADAPNKDEEAKKELKKLQGTWQLVSEVADGNEKTAEECKKTKFTIKDDGSWEVKEDGKLLFKGVSKLIPGQKLKAIDYTLTEGEFKDTVVRAIYELDGDTYKQCFAINADRPTAFEAKAGSGHTYSVYKRQK